MNKSIKTIIALTALFVIGFLALEGCNKKEAKQPKVSGFFVSGCNDVVLHRDNEQNDTIYDEVENQHHKHAILLRR